MKPAQHLKVCLSVLTCQCFCWQEDEHIGTSAEGAALLALDVKSRSPKPKRGKKRSASAAEINDEAGATKRPLFDILASAGEVAHAAAMQQQQQQQQQQHARRAAFNAASAEASTAAGTSNSGASGSSSLASLGEDTSIEEEEAMEALLGLTGGSSDNQSGEDVTMSEAHEDGNGADAPQ